MAKQKTIVEKQPRIAAADQLEAGLSAAYCINDILAEIRSKSFSEKEKGTDFERLMKLWFRTDPRYNTLEKVWLWEEFPSKKDFGGKDLGIDLVARTDYGDYWAIQCKCYAEDANIDKAAVNSFLANASRKFTDPESSQITEFSNLIWVSTSRKPWGANAEEAIQGLNKPFNRINLDDLENSAVDWQQLCNGLYGDSAKLSGKQPRPHQLRAISAANTHFVERGNTRGKLIMACGTGKTYTSLRIMEQITEPDALVLFLVPSIALLGQTLNAWMADKTDDLKAICVCSDAKVTRKMIEADAEDTSVIDLAVPASTNVALITRQLREYRSNKNRTVIFSTYQSIDVVKEAIDAFGHQVDLIICDEAHRTTGIKYKEQDESSFTKIHTDSFIAAKRRLYMTATPRLYRETAKVQAKESDVVLCSMDDAAIYGQEFHRLTFNDAVSQGLLTDYKVLVLTVSEDDIPQSIRTRIKEQYSMAADKDKIKELQFDDATKLIGCINGLSKRIKGDNGITMLQDPNLMKRAVAFCQTIKPTNSNPNFSSTQIALYFGEICENYKNTLPEAEKKNVVNIQAQHIDGSMDANTRNQLIAWLKQESTDPNECRVLCNVRCLSEGVDVPALDAVLFLAPRNSEVEVVQSVGRVMRTFKGKKFGYIIIPVIVPNDVTPELVLADNERFKVVWTILNALRSHDENFNAHVNQINLNQKRPPKITVGGIPSGSYSIGTEAPDGDAIQLSGNEVARQLQLQFGELQDGIYARLVEKVGDKNYYTNWAKSIGEIAQKFIQRITMLVNEKTVAKMKFDEFVKGLHNNINDSIDAAQAIEMLAQHMITRPVFDALFKDYEFLQNNAVSHSMQSMLEILESEGLEMETAIMDRFYTSVVNNVSNIDNLRGKQSIIKDLYEKFFKGAFPLTVEKLGIVYTPVECVDFIIHSIEDILKTEFNTSLTEENVHILDPFTGTGTFITRLLQSGLIRKEDMLRKYRNEIHCNEIVLLAYYIADVNIESVFHDIIHPDKYEMYDGICLTDTFQLNEHGDNDIFSQLFPENSERVLKQMKAPVRVIIGNPPYSVGQKSANDDAANLKYPALDKRVADTYAANTNATNKNSLYDSYIKAFRWASDRIQSLKEGGIVAFISNGAWIDGNAQDGMRKCLQDEFTSVYVFNLRGNARTSGEQRRKEMGNVFGEGTRTTITITILVKNPSKKQSKASIYYHDIGDYLTREQKLQIIRDFKSIRRIDWTELQPNEKNDWINQRDGLFDSQIPIFPNKKFNIKANSFFVVNSRGLETARDAWVYNYSIEKVKENIQQLNREYNANLGKTKQDELNMDETKISWSSSLIAKVLRGEPLNGQHIFTHAVYRPYCKLNAYFGQDYIHRMGQYKDFFPSATNDNLVICVSGVGVTKDFTCIITDQIPDLELIGKSQCFPLYWYEENKNKQKTLFDEETGDDYIRRDGITDWILKEVRSRYGGAKNITKEMIFYYVYGLLHSPDYRQRFAADLKKSLPRIPIVERVEDFMDFYRYGKKLADLHLNYETVLPYDGVEVVGDRQLTGTDADYDYFRVVDKLRFKSKQDKSTIIYNGNIQINNIPAKAYEYVVNGKSAIEWIVERYCVSQDKKSLIRNDANDWAREHHKPRYILDLLLSIINVSVQTVDIVKELPKLSFG
ncbi:MAG: DEAD/DEAH box helicase [Bacteroidales bacterium]|nr:DEAD/DEAH box helicase [Bacteroidales bacterium]